MQTVSTTDVVSESAVSPFQQKMARAARDRLIVLAVLLLVLVLLVLANNNAPPGVQGMPQFPHTMEAGEQIEIQFPPGQSAPKYRVRSSASMPIRLSLGGVEVQCAAGDCVLVAVAGPGRAHLGVSTENAGSLAHLQVEIVKEQHVTTLSGLSAGELLYALLGLISLVLFCGVAQNSPVLTQWVTVGAVGLFIAINDAVFATVLLLFLATMYSARRMLAERERGGRKLLVSLLLGAGFLLLFKYGKAGLYSMFANPGGLNLFLPIGVSYFVIRLTDTQLRWFRGQQLDLSFREFIYFIIFPGTLVAGPIENVRDFYGNRLERIGREDYAAGLARILIGLFKKVVIADGLLYPAMHGENFEELLWGDSGGSVNGLVANPEGAHGSDIFAFAIAGLLFAYVDFSAYSDIAIGLSRLFGYRICENFNFPILAENIREYWQRWHMSLSNWAFRNIYFPVLLRTQNSYLPIMVTMSAIGLWHAFNLSWYAWALHHTVGMFVVAQLQKRAPLPEVLLRVLKPVRILLTLVFASMGFVFVYFSHFGIASTLYARYWSWLLMLE